MTNERLEELKALCENATPDPWKQGGCSGRMIFAYGRTEYGTGGDVADVDTAANSDFIAASRTALPELIATIEKQRAMLKRLEWLDGEWGYLCHICLGEDKKHKPGCELAAMIGG